MVVNITTSFSESPNLVSCLELVTVTDVIMASFILRNYLKRG
jgi:hypothetical protein